MFDGIFGGVSPLVNIDDSDDDMVPKAYLNYIVFDKNMVFQRFGFSQVTEAGNGAHEQLTLNIGSITNAGFVYIYVSNETNADLNVFFDDFEVTHEYAPIAISTDYYPFGMTMEARSYAREDYRFGYQGEFAEKDEETGWNAFQLRMYDPKIGRWMSTDPYGQYASPYLGMGNSPVNGVDPDGGLFGKIRAWIYSIFKGGTVGQDALGNWVVYKQSGVFVPGSFEKIGEAFVYSGEVGIGSTVAKNFGLSFLGGTADFYNATAIGSFLAQSYERQIMSDPKLRSELGIGDGIEYDPLTQLMFGFSVANVVKGVASIGSTGLATRGSGIVHDLVRVRHHTSASGLKGIKRSGSINASRGRPFGVDVEVSPFLKPTNVNLGQAGRGSFVEFSVPRSQLSQIPGFMGGTGNAGRIVTGGTSLNISRSAPRFVKWNWLGF